MGGCCCCASKGELDEPPHNSPLASQEQIPLTVPHHGTQSPTLSTGLLVNPNLDTSNVDTYRRPPDPLPFNHNSRRPLTPSHTEDTNTGEITTASNNPDATDKDPKEAGCKVKGENELALPDTVEFEETDDLKKSSKPFVPEEEEDCCPICLEEYDDENPKLVTNCEHHFHLACILEWMERSEVCPVCDKELILDPSLAS